MEVMLKAPNGTKWSQPLGLFINNKFVNSSEGKTIPTINPTTEEEICAPQAATAADIDTAVQAARTAFKHPSWANLTGRERAVLMHKLANLISQHGDVLAAIDAIDNGKTFATAKHFEVPWAVEVLRYYAGWADKMYGQTADCGPDRVAYTVKAPVGVVAQIIPWNMNIGFVGMKLGPAIACGNAVVLKASEACPLSVLYIAKLVKEAGFPPGVVNFVNGYGGDAGAALVSHPGVDKVSFTGSTETGKAIMRLAAATLKGVTLETGGKTPAIVFEDADLDNAVMWTHRGVMAYSGQMCFANSRVLVQEGVYDAFLAKFKEQVSQVSVLGDPFEKTTFQGPQVSRVQYEKILGYIRGAREEGATVFMGGEPAAFDGKGFFVQPTVFTDVKPGMKIYREEIFGPCVAVVPFKTEEDALEMANDTAYGLSSCVFTSSIARAHRVANGFEAGQVYINSSSTPDIRLPFGGTKQSGIGAENGEAGLLPYYYTKSIYINLKV
ncbi:aldehyde dehydrogenase [Annulohypoxylon maeteangense]|uniref:aldehyde dehydrogenase n=1 Tax=Annulohypoxylon maeteangense TaxID=1927788 RepID=UPI002007F6ED|nr:aldehyde dehydrogenase [Annulohypoxylon maeteangense]KAI0887489.1 aldehyde dehydrogenase [Annulohypoxylon maeteangense]